MVKNTWSIHPGCERGTCNNILSEAEAFKVLYRTDQLENKRQTNKKSIRLSSSKYVLMLTMHTMKHLRFNTERINWKRKDKQI